MLISDFIARCDAFCAEREQSRVWLSKRLFNDTFKLDNLANGTADIGVRRMQKACGDLAALAGDALSDHAASVPDRAACGAEKDRRNVSRTDEPGLSGAAA
ncbi:hypothetical protein [Brevundimonas sp.]|uniref:hypothetical protein n=1 Tax=Brevundimonas sp. TaxID=1871086 RepID=UPI00289F0B6B|nr:hypothetical protein [Brevundimonas sp.]